jgi:hypothetical protein
MMELVGAATATLTEHMNVKYAMRGNTPQAELLVKNVRLAQ